MHDWRADIRARVASARLHPQDEAELVEEVAQHLEAQFDELARTIGKAAAREKLLAQLSNQEFDDALARRRKRTKPAPSQTWTSTSVLRDVRYGFRSLRRSPGTVAAGVVALALGIGLTTIMYSVIYGLLIKGLPFDDADRIAAVQHGDPAREDERVVLGSFVRYQQQQHSFEAFGATSLGNVNVSGGDRPDHVTANWITAGTFEVTKTRPLLGRSFVPNDNLPTSPPTAVLSYAMWRDQYARDSAVVGQTIRVNGKPFTIVGVMPEHFEFPWPSKLWLPIQDDATTLRPWEGRPLNVVGRLRTGVTFERAGVEFATLSKQLAAERPSGTPEKRARLLPYVRATVPDRVYTVFNAMLIAVFLVLLVACSNVANLLLDRAVGRTREIGIRTALGASRLAVIRQSLVESAILAALAAIVGTIIAQAGIVLFNRAMVDVQRPFWMDVRLHPPVLLFVLGISAVASVVSGLLPAIQSAKLDISSILKDEAHSTSSLRIGRLSKLIVAGEIAISAALLVATGFMTKSIINTRSIDPGFTTADISTAHVTLTTRDSVRQRQFYETLDRELSALPGANSVYLGSGLPGVEWQGTRIAVDGQTYPHTRDYPLAWTLAVTPSFFSMFDVRGQRGRLITTADRSGTAPVAVVSEEFVRRFFPARDPIGQRVRLGADGRDTSAHWFTIVGVVPTQFVGSFSVENRWPPQVITSFWQQPLVSSASIAVRGPSDVGSAEAIRKIVTAIDPDVPVYATASMADLLARPMWPFYVFGTMFIVFGIAALILAAIGLYAVMAFSVSRRVREMGIRMALGASGRDVIRLICVQGARQTVIGMALGFVAGGAIVQAARATLFEVQPRDPGVFTLVAVVLAGAALAACIIPALRATRVDPLVALRTD
jgi:predicted permease